MPSSAPDVATEIDVGERLRAIRALRRCTLKTVADRSGLSESFISQVERGRSNASIASLRRIADALGVSVSDLFEPTGPPAPRVLRREDRPALSFGILGRKLLLTPKPLHHLEVFVGELEPGGSTGTEPYAHGDSEELFVVLQGRSSSSSAASSTSWSRETASTTGARRRTASRTSGTRSRK